MRHAIPVDTDLCRRIQPGQRNGGGKLAAWQRHRAYILGYGLRRGRFGGVEWRISGHGPSTGLA
ncbi:hypothetical protein GCM10011505_44590 [Tistrella bauzanensis]|uniref:Uncharacterized protein n=1 Tax=Tistrella bauzanensis TaxID=657419 RepID=A0ABQ1J680_9PROT|nr:hypothetical protein GCM10011505_44590 [Tistrella bauzanensis]